MYSAQATPTHSPAILAQASLSEAKCILFDAQDKVTFPSG